MLNLTNFLLNIFFFKQKTAYEILRCLVGSEMCIRDRFEINVVSWKSAIYEWNAYKQLHLQHFFETSR